MIINLVGSKEGEALIGKMFKAHHKSSPFGKDVPYVKFDYHHYCQRGREDNLKILKDQIIKYLKDFKYFFQEKGVVESQQNGTFRVNCIDCLDRTNRVQTFIGLEVYFFSQMFESFLIKIYSTDFEPTVGVFRS